MRCVTRIDSVPYGVMQAAMTAARKNKSQRTASDTRRDRSVLDTASRPNAPISSKPKVKPP
jgi:hypothetical protein